MLGRHSCKRRRVRGRDRRRRSASAPRRRQSSCRLSVSWRMWSEIWSRRSESSGITKCYSAGAGRTHAAHCSRKVTAEQELQECEKRRPATTRAVGTAT